MTRGERTVVGLHADRDDALTLSPEEAAEPGVAEDAPEPRRSFPYALVVLAILAVAWVALVVVSMDRGSSGPPLMLAIFNDLIAAPLALLGVIALLLLRTSRSESRRFLASSEGMRAESVRLEARVAELTARVDANRQALADQALQLSQIGEEAASRIASLSAAFRHDGEALEQHAATLTQAAGAASNELGAVLASLPKAEAQTQGIAEALNRAGEAALGQAGALEAQLSALLSRGREADELASGAALRLATQLAKVEGTTEAARAQLDQAAERMNAAAQEALARSAEALDEARRSIEAQGAAMLAMVDQSRAALDTSGVQTAEALSARIAEIGAQVEGLGQALGTHDATGSALIDRLSTGVANVEQRLERLEQDGGARTQQLSAAVAALGDHADRLAGSLAGAGEAADGFIARSEALLTALDASAREIDETLPAALARLDGHTARSREQIDAMRPAVGEVEAGATGALDRLAQTERLLQQQREAVELFGQAAERQLQSGKRAAGELTTTLYEANAQMAAVADGSGPQLIEVMLRVRDAASQAAERARETFERIVPQAAASIGHAADQALEQVVAERVEKQVLAVAEAAERAVDAANAAAAMLQEQIARVEQGATALEARVEAAQAQSDEANRESFSRRAALLMEALNSTAIDVAKVLTNDVPDSAWQAYLKGDRGVFTRRAVRLLETGESRAILSYYDSDPEFRDQVNRYIHDFEAMLRNILATRDGNQVAVTLLSSDMGKLYVALAQAIERLRT
jgi:hypothetical protein